MRVEIVSRNAATKPMINSYIYIYEMAYSPKHEAFIGLSWTDSYGSLFLIYSIFSFIDFSGDRQVIVEPPELKACVYFFYSVFFFVSFTICQFAIANS